MKTNLYNRGQSLIGIIIVLVIVGLLGSGLYIYLSKQIPEVLEIAEKPAEEEIIKPEEITPPPEEITPPEEVVTLPCQNECSPSGSKRCLNNGYQICGNYDADNCLEWSPTTICPQNTICQNGACIQQKCSDGTLYGQCSTNKPKYCDNGNLVNKASLCGCPSGYKISDNQCVIESLTTELKIGVVYISESDQTYNPNWRTDLYPYKNKIENALNNIFSKQGKKFVVDFLGEFRANNLCWNPNRIAFIQEFVEYPGSIKHGWYIKMPGGELSRGAGNYTCLPKHRTILWSDCDPTRCEEFNNPNLPDSRCFRVKCDQKYFTLSLQNLAWINSLLNDLKSNNIDFSKYNYKVIVLGKAGPIIPQIGEKEVHFLCNTMTVGDIMGYYFSPLNAIVMSENGLRIPPYYLCKEGALIHTPRLAMPGWQQIIHEILHTFGAVDVYEFDWQKNPHREAALRLEPESEVEKSIMANGWFGFCNKYQATYSCTAEDLEKIYLDKYNRIKLGLE